MNNLMNIVEEKNINYIYTDYFDTVISRKIHPENIKRLWAKQVSRYLDADIDGAFVYDLRSKLEIELCERNYSDGFDKEFIYGDMVERLYDHLSREFSIGYPKENFMDDCFRIEVELESKYQYVNEDWSKVISEIKEKHPKIKVTCISDFYMPTKFLHEMVKHHKLGHLIEDIYISSEFKLTKRTGRLYEHLIECEVINPSESIMIGDNYEADVENAKKNGLFANHLNRSETYKFYDKQYKESEDEIATGSKIEKLLSKKGELPFLELSGSLALFIEKLYGELQQRNAKDVFFFSREGEFLKRVFDYYQENFCSSINIIKTHYLLVSRKATFLPSLKALCEEDFHILFRQYVNLSLYDFLMSLGFSEEEIEKVCQLLSVDKHKKHSNFNTSDVFLSLKELPMFVDLYEMKRGDQKENFSKYLSSFGYDKNCGEIHVVDVGWKGSIQDNISRYLGEDVTCYGYYLGLVAPGELSKHNQKLGLVFSGINGRSPNFTIYNENRALFEMLLGASHGSASKYAIENNKATVLTSEKVEERKLFLEVVKPIQETLWKTLIQIFACTEDTVYELVDVEAVISQLHSRMVFFPTKDEINFFNKMYHYENFGVFEFTEFNKREKISFADKVMSTLKLIKNPRRFFETGFWGPITLDNHGLFYLVKPYGYYKLYKMKKIDGVNPGKGTRAPEAKEIEALKQLLEDRDIAIKNMTTMIDDRDAAIKSMTKMIDDRDLYIKELEQKR